MRRARCIDALIDGLLLSQPSLDKSSIGAYLSSNTCGLCTATFIDKMCGPIAIAKFATRTGRESVITREFETLAALHGSGSSASRRVPEAMRLLELSPGPVAYYSYVPGRQTVASEVVFDDAFTHRVVEWAAELHKCLRSDVVLDEATLDTLITAPARAALALSGVDQSFHTALDNGVLLAKQMIGESVPLVLAHGDLWAGNVMIDHESSEFSVIDWDLAEEGRLPLTDLFHWFFHNALEHYRVDWMDAAAMCVRSGGKYGRMFRSALTSYCEALGWYPKNLGALLVAHFIFRKSAPLLRDGLQWSPAKNHEWVFVLPHVWQIGEDLGAVLEEAHATPA